MEVTADDSASIRIQERLTKHLLELSELKAEVMQLDDVPDARMEELRNQLKAIYDLLY